MIEKSIKVDEQTDRLVTDLAYFLRCSKKTIVREAVTEFAEARRAGTAVAGAGASFRGTGTAMPRDGLAQPGAGEAFLSTGAAVPRDGLALPSPGAAVPRDGAAMAGNGPAQPGAGAALPRATTFVDLPLADRLAVRRNELIREFAKRGATNVRLFMPATEKEAIAEVNLLVETDLADGSFAIPVLEEVARTLLAAPVHIVSSTALALFRPAALERALAESRPL